MIKVLLERDQLWNGVFYLKGLRSIPDDLAIALNLKQNKPNESPPQERPISGVGIPALELINSAETEAELVVLPTIGYSRGRRLMALRPLRGFESLDHAAELLDIDSVDWEAIACWEPKP